MKESGEVMQMLKTNEQYTVIREYDNRFGTEELLRRIIRQHVRDAYWKNEAFGLPNREVNCHVTECRG